MFYCLKLFLIKHFTTIFIFLEHLEDWQKTQKQGTLENCVCLKMISKLRDVFLFEVHNPAKPYSSLKILLGSQDNFYIILSSYVERHLKKKKKKKKNQVWISCLWLLSMCLKSGGFMENLLCSKFWNHLPAEIIP